MLAMTRFTGPRAPLVRITVINVLLAVSLAL